MDCSVQKTQHATRSILDLDAIAVTEPPGSFCGTVSKSREIESPHGDKLRTKAETASQFRPMVGIYELQESLDLVTNKETLSSRLGT